MFIISHRGRPEGCDSPGGSPGSCERRKEEGGRRKEEGGRRNKYKLVAVVLFIDRVKVCFKRFLPCSSGGDGIQSGFVYPPRGTYPHTESHTWGRRRGEGEEEGEKEEK